MSYKLHFIKKSKKEWDRLNSTIKEQFKKKLAKRLVEPIVAGDKPSGYENVYKIKLRSSGYRLAYEVREDKIIIVVLAIGKRENNDIYDSLKKRLDYDI
jgi:mRNA interferase RelE/StbE